MTQISSKISSLIVQGAFIYTEARKNIAFMSLLKTYQTTIALLEGRGEEGQATLDNAYQELCLFIKHNPEFSGKLKSLVPHKHILYNDGSGGMHQAYLDACRISCLNR